MKPTIKMQLKTPVKIFKEDDVFVSYCPIFDLSSQGITEIEAKKNLAEALSGFLLTCFEMGTFEAVLKECGFAPGEEPNSLDNSNDDFVDIPLPFMLAGSDNKACHA